MNAEFRDIILNRLTICCIALDAALERPNLMPERIRNVQRQMRLIAKLIREDARDNKGAVREEKEQV
jgi:hypothetical protein